MADGSITFSTELDNSGIQKDLNAAKREIEKATKSLQDSKNAKLPLVKQAEELGAALDEAKAKLYDLQKQQSAANHALNSAAPGPYIDAAASKPELDAAVVEQNRQVENLQKQWDSINDKIDKYDQKITQASNSIAQQQQIAGGLSAKLMSSSSNTAKSTQKTASATQKANREMSKMAQATAKVHQSADHIGKRMSRIVSQVFLFGMVSKALYGVAEYMGKALKGNKEFTAELAKLKGALLTAFQPIYEVLVPALMALMRIATSVAQAIARVFSLITGKSTSEYAKNAKALYEQANATESVGKAAEKAKKSLAGFDEINQLSANDDTAGIGTATDAASSPDFSGFDTAEYKDKIDELVVYISAALLVLGIILTFSGANIPLGIGLIAAGAIGLAAEVATNWDTVKQIIEEKAGLIAAISGLLLAIGLILALSGANLPLGIGLIAAGAVGLAATVAVNWDSIAQALQGPIGSVTMIASTALLALGLILTMSGAAIPLGIGLIAVGAIGLVTVAAVNWNSIEQALKGPIGAVTAIASTALLVLGIILVCSGIGIPLGIALIAAGAAGLVAVTAVNWDFIKDKVSEMWDGVKSVCRQIPTWFEEHITEPIANFFKGMVNGVIGFINGMMSCIASGINLVIRALNKLSFDVPDWVPGIGGSTWGFNIPEITAKKIPYLAQGAVLPANKPFLAMVGDQKHGTNVEAPLTTIQEAVAIVMEDMVQSNVAGFEATIAVLREILEAVLGIEIGDDVIGRAAARYNNRLAIRNGGVRT